jgi:hypothetical protein
VTVAPARPLMPRGSRKNLLGKPGSFFGLSPQLIDSVKPTAVYMHVAYHGDGG